MNFFEKTRKLIIAKLETTESGVNDLIGSLVNEVEIANEIDRDVVLNEVDGCIARLEEVRRLLYTCDGYADALTDNQSDK